MDTMTVMLGERSYPITITSGFMKKFSFMHIKEGEKMMIITNQTLEPLYMKDIRKMIKKSGGTIEKVIIPDGEKYKSLDILEKVFDSLLEKIHGRNTILIALGGGVLGDITGFAASCYQRGVRFIQVPTTLLSQVDSSVGGKTAVNHNRGKNMIGSFHQPISVWIDVYFLKTLPRCELSSGLSEVIKYGIIMDYNFFVWIEKNINSIMLLNRENLIYCIIICCELKATVVIADEKEKNGKRALLNLGHTYGHAIEAEIGYGVWLHGEAVAVGIIIAAYNAFLLCGTLSIENIKRMKNILTIVGLPVNSPKKITEYSYLPHMRRDKKVVMEEKLNLVLPKKMGESELFGEILYDTVLTSIEYCIYI